jgi:hypothetical protein
MGDSQKVGILISVGRVTSSKDVPFVAKYGRRNKDDCHSHSYSQ